MERRGPGGRPSRFSEELGEALIRHVSAGISREDSAARCGIGRRTLQEWLARGRAGEPRFAAWAERYTTVWLLKRRERVWASAEAEELRSKERWRKFKASREPWRRRRLGEEAFWTRRLNWLLEKGRYDAFQRTVEGLRRAGYRVDRCG